MNFDRVDESQAFDYDVVGVQVHEGYALPAKYNDIAILTLKYPVSRLGIYPTLLLNKFFFQTLLIRTSVDIVFHCNLLPYTAFFVCSFV